MEQEDSALSPSEKKFGMEEVSNDIEDIDKLATRPPQKVKPYQENFIEEKSSKARIAESQESTRGKLAIAIIGIYGYLASKEALAVKRHGKLVEFYIPVSQSEEEEIEQALQRLNQTVAKAIVKSGMDEAALADALDLSQEEQ
jgi:leucyl-tRNA synthetase